MLEVSRDFLKGSLKAFCRLDRVFYISYTDRLFQEGLERFCINLNRRLTGSYSFCRRLAKGLRVFWRVRRRFMGLKISYSLQWKLMKVPPVVLWSGSCAEGLYNEALRRVHGSAG